METADASGSFPLVEASGSLPQTLSVPCRALFLPAPSVPPSGLLPPPVVEEPKAKPKGPGGGPSPLQPATSQPLSSEQPSLSPERDQAPPSFRKLAPVADQDQDGGQGMGRSSGGGGGTDVNYAGGASGADVGPGGGGRDYSGSGLGEGAKLPPPPLLQQLKAQSLAPLLAQSRPLAVPGEGSAAADVAHANPVPVSLAAFAGGAAGPAADKPPAPAALQPPPSAAMSPDPAMPLLPGTGVPWALLLTDFPPLPSRRAHVPQQPRPTLEAAVPPAALAVAATALEPGLAATTAEPAVAATAGVERKPGVVAMEITCTMAAGTTRVSVTGFTNDVAPPPLPLHARGGDRTATAAIHLELTELTGMGLTDYRIASELAARLRNAPPVSPLPKAPGRLRAPGGAPPPPSLHGPPGVVRRAAAEAELAYAELEALLTLSFAAPTRDVILLPPVSLATAAAAPTGVRQQVAVATAASAATRAATSTATVANGHGNRECKDGFEEGAAARQRLNALRFSTRQLLESVADRLLAAVLKWRLRETAVAEAILRELQRPPAPSAAAAETAAQGGKPALSLPREGPLAAAAALGGSRLQPAAPERRAPVKVASTASTVAAVAAPSPKAALTTTWLKEATPPVPGLMELKLAQTAATAAVTAALAAAARGVGKNQLLPPDDDAGAPSSSAEEEAEDERAEHGEQEGDAEEEEYVDALGSESGSEARR
ncbi:hypothetical protein GPECTOR_3g127 [Gonium pectorale]|uniref:Uncharacterized protein n=1 Tax=Gonium pectorale TaxID=33097 RepID=A0A150GYN5_GONPE|nr:hypothetical protein GPECTOR_3g127 [Gonium pectorale]|eukprot:KXZ54959.1 hypothetical protein GPECTOR_3g127 [Gonium pectorale]